MATGRTVSAEPPKVDKAKGRVVGLYCGGTLCSEAEIIFGRLGLSGHRFVDLGNDQYTRGRPHPMIDPELRNEHVARAMADRTVGAVLVDVVLGFGSHRDPAGVLLKTKLSKPVVASVTGTDDDPQSRALQVARLRDAGSGCRALECARRRVGRGARSLSDPRHRDDPRERVPAGGVADVVKTRKAGVQIGRMPG